MGVQFNLKDEDTVRRARALATRSGKSVTAIFREAIAEKESRDDPRPYIDAPAILARFAALRDGWRPELRDLELSLRHADLLYDEHGAPL